MGINIGGVSSMSAAYVGNNEITKIYVGGNLVWQKITTSFTITTNSTSSTWAPQNIINSGSTLHWEVTGAVTASYDGNIPNFDFSTAGDKFITVTSGDNLIGVTYLLIANLNITELYVNDLINLTYLNCGGNNLTTLDVSNLTNLSELRTILNELTTLNISGTTELAYLDCRYNILDQADVNNILDKLILFNNNSGSYLNLTEQSPLAYADEDKAAALDVIWNEVYCDFAPPLPINITTISESSVWSPQLVVNSGVTLHWEVTGVVEYTYDGNDPVFDFSTVGEKTISISNATNLTELEIYSLDITEVDFTTGFDSLQKINLADNRLTTLTLNLPTLTTLSINDNDITTLTLSSLNNLIDINFSYNILNSTSINSLLDQLISIGNINGTYLNGTSQTPIAYADSTKVNNLDAIWDVVVCDVEAPPVASFTMTTTSTNSTWTPQEMTNTGDYDLHWEVTGAVTASYDGNDPTFDFSTPGTKNITVTNISGLIDVWMESLSITEIDVTDVVALTSLSLVDNLISSIDLSENVNLIGLFIDENPNLTSITFPNSSNLIDIQCNACTSLSAFDITNLTVAITTIVSNCALNSTQLDGILDVYIRNNITGSPNGYNIHLEDQSPIACPSQGKVDAVEALGCIVTYDACPTSQFTMTTNSTSSTWSPQDIVNTGDYDLHWEVTGAVTASYDGNDPTFDFSTPGTKNITVTSTDGFVGLTDMNLDGLSITGIDITNLINLEAISLENNLLSQINILNNVNLISLLVGGNSITSLTLPTSTSLVDVSCTNNTTLTSLNISGTTAIKTLDCSGCALNSTQLNNILNVFIDNNITSGQPYWIEMQGQTPTSYPLLTKVNEVEFLGCQVNFDTPPLYAVTVYDCTNSLIATGNFPDSQPIDIDGNTPIGYQFVEWTGATADHFGDVNAEITTFTPTAPATVRGVCEAIPAAQFTMTTNSTSGTWGDGTTGGLIGITNSGAILHWEVTGAVTYSYDGNSPVFDFSTAGDKFITVTSSDNLINLTELLIVNLELTALDITELVSLTTLVINNTQITVLDVSTLTNLTALGLYNMDITTLNVLPLVSLTDLALDNIQLTTLDVSTLVNLINLDLSNLELPNVNDILDDLIAIGNVNGSRFYSDVCGDAAKIAALDAIWGTVLVDACTPTYTLTVINSTGSGEYNAGDLIQVSADPPEEGYQFKEWIGDIEYLDNPQSSIVNLTMPAADITIEATYELTPIDWTYEGVMTFEHFTEENNEIYSFSSGLYSEGTATPLINFDFSSYDFRIFNRLKDGIYTLEIIAYTEDVASDTFLEDDPLRININNTDYYVPFNLDKGWFILEVDNFMFNDLDSFDIKLKYTLANQTVTIDGEVYETVTIGTQTWLKRNLHVDDSGGGIYSYGNLTSNSDIYGYLYTWDAAVRVAASVEGWHLPSNEEWTTLTTYLGGTSVAGGEMKEAGTNHWLTPNTGAANSSGFTALPGGQRNTTPQYTGINSYGFWHSATENTINLYADRFYLYTSSSSININTIIKTYASSVRLIKD